MMETNIPKPEDPSRFTAPLGSASRSKTLRIATMIGASVMCLGFALQNPIEGGFAFGTLWMGFGIGMSMNE